MVQYFARSSKQLALREGPPTYETISKFESPGEPARQAVYSPDGSRFAYLLAKEAVVVDTNTLKPQHKLGPESAAADCVFSPAGRFLLTWTRPVKNPEDGNWQPNLRLWDLSTGTKVGDYLQKVQGSWNVQFSADEKWLVRQHGAKELVVEDTGKLGSEGSSSVGKLQIPDGIAEFSVSSGKNPSVAVFIAAVKGKPASVRVYKLPGLAHPVAQRSLFQAESVLFQWNSLGTALLITAQTDDDKSGKSYYGSSTLYLLSVNSGGDQRIMLDKEGPVHDVSWSPSGDEFGVVYGYMPSKTTFFDGRGREIQSLPLSPRNALKYSPHSRFVIVAGFGNLKGVMDVRDRQQNYGLVASIEAPNSTFYDWSPCGRLILTATTSPRLRVDNGIKLWWYAGKLVYQEDFDELYAVGWRPEHVALDITKPVEPHDSAKHHNPAPKPETKGAYRPPHARNSAVSPSPTMSLYQRSLLGSKGGNGTGSKSQHQPQNQATSTTSAAPEKTVKPEDKQIRGLVKKLRAIGELRTRQAGGEKLEQTQLQKIDSEAEVLKKLEALGWSE